MHALVLLGVAGGVLAVLDPLPYLRDVVRGTTRPHRGTWLIWAVLGCIALAAQVAGGGGWSVVFLAVQAVTMTLTVVLAVPCGVGGTSARDLALLGLAGAGVAGWLLLDAPLVATVCVCVADAVGFVLMLPKAWHQPWSETASTYVLCGLSGLCGAGAVGAASLHLLLYPVYFGLANLAMGLLLVHRKRVLAATTSVTAATAAGTDASRTALGV